MRQINLWPEGSTIQGALGAVGHRLTERQARLLACACARVDWKQLRSEASRRAVALAERHADGQRVGDRLSQAGVEARKAVGRWGDGWQVAAATVAALAASDHSNLRDHLAVLGPALGELSRRGDQAGGCRFVWVLRDLLAPSAVQRFPSSWRSPDVRALARQAYEGHDLGALPVLGDALEDAGCDWAELLEHCRGPARHVRGCWALGLVLGHEGRGGQPHA